MKEHQIMLNATEDVKEFVNAASKCDFDIDISYNRVIIDAKSFLGSRAMDIAVGDTILTRKKHPCGASSFEVLRVGMDFKIRCTGCGREVMLPRAKIEKNIKKVVKPGQA